MGPGAAQFALKRGGEEGGHPVGKISFIDLAGSERGADTYDNNRCFDGGLVQSRPTAGFLPVSLGRAALALVNTSLGLQPGRSVPGSPILLMLVGWQC